MRALIYTEPILSYICIKKGDYLTVSSSFMSPRKCKIHVTIYLFIQNIASGLPTGLPTGLPVRW